MPPHPAPALLSIPIIHFQTRTTQLFNDRSSSHVPGPVPDADYQGSHPGKPAAMMPLPSGSLLSCSWAPILLTSLNSRIDMGTPAGQRTVASIACSRGRQGKQEIPKGSEVTLRQCSLCGRLSISLSRTGPGLEAWGSWSTVSQSWRPANPLHCQPFSVELLGPPDPGGCKPRS